MVEALKAPRNVGVNPGFTVTLNCTKPFLQEAGIRPAYLS